MKKYRVGVVGYGWAAGAHIEAINSGSRGQVVAVCSSRGLDPAELSSRHGCPIRSYTALGDLLNDPEIDAVSICGYHSQHKDHVLAAAAAGKHMIVEKPLALRWADVAAIEKAVQSSGVGFCACFELRFSRQFLETKALLDQGLLGELHYGEIDYYHGVGPWYREYEWVTTNEACGSSLLAAGCHALDALLLCLGDDVEEVFSYAGGSKNPIFTKYEYPTTTTTLLKFHSGKLGKVATVIDCLQPYYFHTHLLGSEGSLLDNRYCSTRAPGGDRHHWITLPFQPVDSGDVHDHPYRSQFDSFFESLDKGQAMPLTGLRQAVRTHEVVFAADLSWKEKRPVKVAEIRDRS